jgi:hypothetical protein
MPRGAPCRSGRCSSGEGSGHRTGPCSSNSGQELSAVETGVRILPLSITLLLAALAGAVLISALTNSFLSGIEANPDVPDDVAAQAQIELAGGVRSSPTTS